MRLAGHLVLVVLLTALSLVGGLAWVLTFRRRLAFPVAYLGLSLAAHYAAPLRVQSPLYCALNRNYAAPRLGRIFIEPHLRESLWVGGAKFGFQGCRAARHDDHIHIQL